MGNYADPLIDLVARLEAHLGAGRILEGWKLVTIPTRETEGTEDLPSLKVLTPVLQEVERARFIAVATITVQLKLAVAREGGLPALLQGAEKVMDAVEHDVAGEFNPALAGCRSLVRMTMAASIPLDLSLAGVITLTVEPKLTTRGGRRL